MLVVLSLCLVMALYSELQSEIVLSVITYTGALTADLLHYHFR